MPKATPKNGKKVSVPPGHGIGLLELMRAILAMSRPTEECEFFAPAPGGTGETVVIDTDVDGERYVLIRMPQVERKSPPLSPRELEIVRMVAQGHPNKIIAVVLNISSWTVCTHLRRIFAKLGVSSRAAMVARLVEFGAPPEPAGGIERPLLRPAATVAMSAIAAAGPVPPPGVGRGAYGHGSGPPARRRVPVTRERAPTRDKVRLPAEAR